MLAGVSGGPPNESPPPSTKAGTNGLAWPKAFVETCPFQPEARPPLAAANRGVPVELFPDVLVRPVPEAVNERVTDSSNELFPDPLNTPVLDRLKERFVEAVTDRLEEDLNEPLTGEIAAPGSQPAPSTPLPRRLRISLSRKFSLNKDLRCVS